MEIQAMSNESQARWCFHLITHTLMF